mgnify:CR=1 FL=1
MATENRAGTGKEEIDAGLRAIANEVDAQRLITTAEDKAAYQQAEKNIRADVPSVINDEFLKALGAVYELLIKYPETPPFRRELQAMFKRTNDLINENIKLREALKIAQNRCMQIINGFLVESFKEQQHDVGVGTGQTNFRPHPVELRDYKARMTDQNLKKAQFEHAMREEERGRPHNSLLQANDGKWHPVIIQCGFLEQEAKQIKADAMSLVGK